MQWSGKKKKDLYSLTIIQKSGAEKFVLSTSQHVPNSASSYCVWAQKLTQVCIYNIRPQNSTLSSRVEVAFSSFSSKKKKKEIWVSFRFESHSIRKSIPETHTCIRKSILSFGGRKIKGEKKSLWMLNLFFHSHCKSHQYIGWIYNWLSFTR